MTKFRSKSSMFDKLWPWRLFIARSDAMRPTIFAGDVVVVRRPPRGSDHYGVGDVIAYDADRHDVSPNVRRICMVMHPSNGVTRYVVRRDADGIIADSVVDARHVIGEVEARLVNLGRMVEGSAGRSHRSLSRFAVAPNARRAAPVDRRNQRVLTTDSTEEHEQTASAAESAAD